MSPQEQPLNYSATSRVMIRLSARLGDDWEYLPGAAIAIARAPRLTIASPT